MAITGSVGKTSTKDAVYAALAPSLHVRKSEKSFNSEIGLPLAILGLSNAWSHPFRWAKNLIEGAALLLLKSNYPRILVLEVGADRPGDIKRVARWLAPDAVVLTRFPDVPVHVEFFESPKHVIREKMYLAKAVRDGGTLVLNFDDEKMAKISPPRNGSLLTYGFNDGADIEAKDERVLYDERGRVTGISFVVTYNGGHTEITLKGVLGRQHVYPVLAALALGISQGISLSALAEAIQTYTPPAGRMRILEGINGSTIIDDTYNSSPIAARAALDALVNTTTKGRRIAVVGDMMELGSYSVAEHRAIGKYASEFADVLVAVGIRSRYTAEEAAKGKQLKKKDIHEFNNAEDAGRALKEMVGENDVVLVKGSQSMRMERVVAALMAHPEQKQNLLVRQDPEWQNR